ncbi:MAG: DUF3833 family protein [Bacteroidetes bacterium]|nr:DUF3833 family protein [Bacteroidota bacterium]
MPDSLKIPDFNPKEYFAQNLAAYGVFVDRFGVIRRQFEVSVTGTRSDTGFIRDELCLYDDGERETRQWTVTETRSEAGDGGGVKRFYQGSCLDVVGMAAGVCSQNMLRWQYRFRLAMFGRKVTVKFDDVMVLHAGGVMVNRAVVSKWGFRLGEVLLTFRPS